jgi:mediator of RNA polymerase II transcription subunit 13
MNAVPSPMAPPSTTPIHPGDFGSATQSGMGPPNQGGSTPLQGSSTFGVHHTSTPSSGMTSSDGKPTSPKTEDGADGTSGHGASGATDGSAADDEEVEPPSIVIYIVDPFSFGSDNLDLGRLTALGLLRCYHQMLSLLSETVQLNVSLQLISADAILQLGKDVNGASRYDSLRSLALNVFSQCKKLISQPSNVKSLTGFGPAAASDTFLKAKDERNRAPYRVYIPAYVLAPTKDRTVCDLDPGVSTNGGPGSGPLSFLARPDKYSVLYVSYCLSEDQRWLIAACTDERGELVDSCTIGIDVPNRTKRKRVSVRRFGLQRLMDFILGVISTGVHPWRLVIGRVGRMGHGELKSNITIRFLIFFNRMDL